MFFRMVMFLWEFGLELVAAAKSNTNDHTNKTNRKSIRTLSSPQA
jgi:hypothetical protein